MVDARDVNWRPLDPTISKHLSEGLIGAYEQALEADKERALARFGVGLFHSIADDKAQRHLTEIFKLPARDALDHYNRGCALAARESYADAIKAFVKALELDPQLNDARFNLALATELQGDAAGAKPLWTAYLERCQDEQEAQEIRERLQGGAAPTA